jgi:hypothetical protein
MVTQKRGRNNNEISQQLERTNSIMFPPNNNMNINNNTNKNKNTTSRNAKILKTNSAKNVTNVALNNTENDTENIAKIISSLRKPMSYKKMKELLTARKKYRKEEAAKALRNNSTQKKTKSVHRNFPEEIHEINTTKKDYKNSQLFAEEQIKQAEKNKYSIYPGLFESIYNMMNTLLEKYEIYKNNDFLTYEEKIYLRNKTRKEIAELYEKGEYINSSKQYNYNSNNTTKFVDNPYMYVHENIFKSVQQLALTRKPKINRSIFSQLLKNIILGYTIYRRQNMVKELPEIKDKELINIIFF